MAFGDLLHRMASFIGLEAEERHGSDYDDDEFEDFEDDTRSSSRSLTKYSNTSATKKQPARTSSYSRPTSDDYQSLGRYPGQRATGPLDNIVQLPIENKQPVAPAPKAQPRHSAMIVYVNRRDDAEQLINYVLEGKSVILSCERIDDATCQRVIDMLAGAAYAVEGHVEKISKGNYLFAPASVEISSDSKAAQPRFAAVGGAR